MSAPGFASGKVNNLTLDGRAMDWPLSRWIPSTDPSDYNDPIIVTDIIIIRTVFLTSCNRQH